MPKVSKETAEDVQEAPFGTIWSGLADDYEIDFFHLREEADVSGLLKGLPDDRCTARHWGYVTTGTVTFTFADRAETFGAGDAFYVAEGHVPSSSAGTEYVLISLASEVAEVNETVQRNLEAMQSA